MGITKHTRKGENMTRTELVNLIEALLEAGCDPAAVLKIAANQTIEY